MALVKRFIKLNKNITANNQNETIGIYTIDAKKKMLQINTIPQSEMGKPLNEIKNYSQIILFNEEGLKNLFDMIEPMMSYRKEQKQIEDDCYQIIYYGAPGTGKSYKIKEQLKDVSKDNIFRTTFHPDSDYSTFVGAYKPTRDKKPLYGLNGEQTVRLKDGDDLSEDIITYKFIPQAFLNAYIQAYRRPEEKIYLIIEEINRGNCAQIFGDLFQLLDRGENGASEYSIKADADLKAFLEEELGEGSEGIKDGELCLPSNLYIYATMNTSDQSLFPIDSAFKRRWDWEYEPIKYKNKNWVIDIQGERYSWVSFQKKINERIFDTTNSEDKMLGDYFVNPKDGIITEKILLNKILFYLWNDVCKDGDNEIFKVEKGKEIVDVTFSDFFNGDVVQNLVGWMSFLKVTMDDDVTYDEKESIVKKKYNLNGVEVQKTDLAKIVFEEYSKVYKNKTKEEVLADWENIKDEANKNRNMKTTNSIKHLLTDSDGFENYIEQSKNKERAERRWTKVIYNGIDFYVWNNWGDQTSKNLGNIDSFLNEVRKIWNININVE